MRTEEIKKMRPVERVAGYLARMAEIAEVGARLRNGIEEDWTTEEESEWDRVVDASDPWYQALTPDEFDAISKFDSEVLAPLCRGEWPLPKPLSEIPDLIKRECKACGRLAPLIDHECPDCRH